jgi:Tripartite tricarboxylate transporter family receptor
MLDARWPAAQNTLGPDQGFRAGLAGDQFRIGAGRHPLPALQDRNQRHRRGQGAAGGINYATSGIGSPQHIAMALFAAANHLDMVHIPIITGLANAMAAMPRRLARATR